MLLHGWATGMAKLWHRVVLVRILEYTCIAFLGFCCSALCLEFTRGLAGYEGRPYLAYTAGYVATDFGEVFL